MIDTNVAIYWRDGQPAIRSRLLSLDEPPMISAITQVELEGGIYRDPPNAATRRARNDALLKILPMADLTEEVVRAYGKIIAETGYARSQVLDRLIAATAICHGARLITINGKDLEAISGLDLEIWPDPLG